MSQKFKFSSAKDKCLIIVGVFCAVVYGLRSLALSAILSYLYDRMSMFDADVPFDKVQVRPHNVTNFNDEWNRHFKATQRNLSTEDIYSSSFHKFSTMMALSMFVLSTCYFGMMITLSAAAEHQTTSALNLFVKSLMQQDIAWFDCNQTGSLVSQTADDFQKFQDAIGVNLGFFISCVAGYLISVLYSLTLDWKLTLVAICFTPLFLVSYLIIAISMSVYSKRESDEYAKAGSIAEEVLGSIKTVAAFGGESKEQQRYVEALRSNKNTGYYKALLSTIGMCMFFLTVCSGIAVTAWFGYYLFVNHAESRPDKSHVYCLITVIISVNISGLRLGEVFGHMDAITRAKSSAGRILKLIEQKPNISIDDNRRTILKERIDKICFKNVSFHYPMREDSKVLNGFNLEVQSGETVAIVGESGSGKSTLINLLLRFYDTTEGSVSFNGHDIRDLNPFWLRQQIGFVQQEPILFPTTIAENISYGKVGLTQAKVERAAKQANALNFIEELPKKYETEVGDRGTQLSGGQKQRIAIARALMRDPQILLLDEATSALDSQSEKLVQDTLKNASVGRTTFVIAHRLSTIRHAHRIVVVSFGKIVESGTHESLMDLRGMYYNFATKQETSVEEFRRQIRKESHHKSLIEARFHEENDIRSRKMSMRCSRIESKIPKLSFFRLFRMFWFESLLLVFGMFGSVLFGITYVVVYLEGISELFEIFAFHDDPLNNERAMVEYVTVISICAGLFVFSIALQMGFLGIAGSRLGRKLREKIFASLLRQEMAFFDDVLNGVGALCILLSDDVGNVQNAISLYLGMMLNVVSQIVTSVVLLSVISWKFGLLQFCLLAASFVIAIMLHWILQKKQKQKSNSLRASNELLRQIVMNIRTVVSLGLQNEFHEKLLAIHSSKKFSKCNEYLMLVLNIIVECASETGILFIGMLALPLILNREVVLLGSFRAFGICKVASNIVHSIAVIPKYVAAVNSLDNILDVIDRVPKTRIYSSTEELNLSDLETERKTPLIEFRNIFFAYPARQKLPTLKDFNLAIKRGQMVALVGQSGSGKSTCIQLIQRFYEADSGSVVIGGRSIALFDVKSLRRELSLVQQEPMLFDRSVAENIAYGDNTREVAMEEIVEAAKTAQAHDFIVTLPEGYHTRVGERGAHISGGQKQRIAIARALIRRSKIMLLDEATSALDSETEKKVQNSLKEKCVGVTFLIVAHRLSTIIDADSIAVVDKGKIVEIGTHDELILRRGLYFKLHQNLEN